MHMAHRMLGLSALAPRNCKRADLVLARAEAPAHDQRASIVVQTMDQQQRLGFGQARVKIYDIEVG